MQRVCASLHDASSEDEAEGQEVALAVLSRSSLSVRVGGGEESVGPADKTSRGPHDKGAGRLKGDVEDVVKLRLAGGEKKAGSECKRCDRTDSQEAAGGEVSALRLGHEVVGNDLTCTESHESVVLLNVLGRLALHDEAGAAV